MNIALADQKFEDSKGKLKCSTQWPPGAAFHENQSLLGELLPLCHPDVTSKQNPAILTGDPHLA
jgi:hypothetical protein